MKTIGAGHRYCFLFNNRHDQIHLPVAQHTLAPTGILLFSFEVVSDFAIPCTAARQTLLSFTVSQSLLKFMSIESVIVSNHLNLCHPLLLPSVFLSIRVFFSESVLHIWQPKYWSFNVSPSNEYSALISFRMDWLDLLAVQGTLKSLL